MYVILVKWSQAKRLATLETRLSMVLDYLNIFSMTSSRYKYQCEWSTIQYIPRKMHMVLLCFAVVMQSFIMNSHEVFIHIHQGCFAGTGAIVRLPQCQWSKPDGYGKISQCITTTKHSKAKTVCIFPAIYCMSIVLFCHHYQNHTVIIVKTWNDIVTKDI